MFTHISPFTFYLAFGLIGLLLISTLITLLVDSFRDGIQYTLLPIVYLGLTLAVMIVGLVAAQDNQSGPAIGMFFAFIALSMGMQWASPTATMVRARIRSAFRH